MRDLGITVLVALLIVLAGVRFSGYQSQLSLDTTEPDSTAASVIDATTPSATSTASTGTPATSGTVTTPSPSVVGASLEAKNQKAGDTVMIDSVNVPEGSYWVAVHEGTRTLGARLFGKGVSTGAVQLLRPTVAGSSYTISLRKDNGDRAYNRTSDVEVMDAMGKAIQVVISAQ